MKLSTLMSVREGKLYLAMKKHKVGAGLYNGYGGKLEPKDGWSIDKANDREFTEETHAFAITEKIEKVAIIDFFENGTHIFECHIYFCHDWAGELEESDQMGPPEVFDLSDPPYEEMMPGDLLWFKRICSGEKIRGKCYYSKGNGSVERFEYQPLD